MAELEAPGRGGRARVLWLIKGLGPGGAERLLVHAAASIDQTRFEVEAAYVVPVKSQLVPELRAHGIATELLGRGSITTWLPALRRLLRSRRYDIVHSHSPLLAAATRLTIRSLPRSQRPQLVSTEHNLWERYARPTRVANRLTASLDDARFAVSGAVKDALPQALALDTEVVVHGIDVDAISAVRDERQAVRDELHVAPGDFVVGVVANFRASKAYPDLLEAARIAREEIDGFRVLVVGQGPLADEIEALRDQLGLQATVELLGYREDAVRVLSGCDVFSLSSRQEGLPVALMEALALGIPVVCTRVGGIPEAVTDGVEGLLVAPARPDLLAKAWVELAGDPQRRAEMREHAMKRGAAFTIDHAVRRTEEVYEQLLADRSATKP